MSKTYNRSKLLKITADMGYSSSLRHEIMLLFKDIKEEDKEELAKNIIPLVESSQTEQEILTKVTQFMEG